MARYVNCYGEEFVERKEPSPYMVDASTSGVTYICYRDTTMRAVRRIRTVSGVTTIDFAYCKWADRASATYYPINEAVEVE